jgi:D-alanine--poly(phosphoribitol) ligase subunit 1
MYEYNLAIRFERVAAESPNHTALWLSAETTVSYAELNKSANRIARALSVKGVRSGDVVCISGRKTIPTFALIIACLKLGVVYSVLDPDSPPERLGKILATCAPRLVVGDQEFLEQAQRFGFELLQADTELSAGAISQFDDQNLIESLSVTGNNPAYIMFTSGSTGFPKGAVMTHANVLNLCDWAQETFAITADDILTNVNPLYFDNSVFDLYAALFNGARLVPFTREETKDPGRLVGKVDDAACTLWFSVPSLLIFLQTMRATDGKHLRSISRFIFGGEGYPKAKLKGLYDAYPQARLFNVYGPTECTCICSSHELAPEDFDDLQGLPRLGRIAKNFEFLILDDQDRIVPAGETGELCLLGPNVGRGYYNDPERTAASFVQNPNNLHFEELIYKTGDLARVDAQGDLYIQGRKDNQIKHMGYRIELEEIEAALNCLAYVSEAAVLHTNINGLSRIVAVIAATEEPDGERLRADLKQIIPDYMIPAQFHREEVLPKNPNGKVDRRHLAQKYLQPAAAKGSVNR